ncbi:MAG: L-arabinose isomerase [Bacteroidales bacterium]|jgi:L-arabinose isomerase|nr:L-arabinose isomerase [Bacteroidales bacterium]
MTNINNYEVWFITGSQHLYGEGPLKQVADHAQAITAALNDASNIPVKVVYKPVMTNSEAIKKLCMAANESDHCVGLIMWMHTFSPAKIWMAGLQTLKKPYVHLHTQYNRDIPWSEIDMDFMNLNQSAHGGREFGFMASRLRQNRKVIVGHWQDEEVIRKLAVWSRTACAWHDAQGAKIARFGDNMRNVAVTEGDKVAAQQQMGYDVAGYGIGELVNYVNQVEDKDVDRLVEQYGDIYQIDPSVQKEKDKFNSLREAARIEIGMKAFLEDGDFKGFTTNFEDLHGLVQLPGLAVQRLMAEGYGFGAEGDWKTAALLRAVKVMGTGLEGGSSFMEDYTYHLEPGNMKVLGAHMLEVCPSLSREKPSLEVHPLSIGGKDDPARLVFSVPTGPGINVSVMDMGNRFRMVANKVNVTEIPSLPNLPVARVAWEPEPDLKKAAEAWIHAGGAHHTAFSMTIDDEYLENFAEMAGIEFLLIDENTSISDFKKELRWNEIYHHLARGI